MPINRFVRSKDPGPSPGREREQRVLVVMVAVLVISTVLAVVGKLMGLGGVRGGGGQPARVMAWNGLLWLALLAAVLWRCRAYVRRLRSRVATADEQLAGLVATTHEWIWESDARFVLTSCGPAVARLLGRTPAEMVGRSMFEFMEPADVPRARAAFTTALQNGTGWTDFVATWRHLDGRGVPMTGSAVPVFSYRGEITAFRGSRGAVAADSVLADELDNVTRHVRAVINDEALTVALQPIVDLSCGGWIGVEALSRFPDGTPPATLFAQADEVGLGPDLELLAIRRALEAFGALPRHVSLSVNASPACVVNEYFAAEMTRPGLDLNRVIVEITEHSAVASYEDINQVLGPLRRQGLRVAVDDTGAGYASFSHVLKLRPNVIKLDRSLIAGIHEDPARRSFVTAIVLMALDLDASVTAEGVEDVRELEVLASLGVDHAQGFLICEPTVAPEKWDTWQNTAWIKASERVG